MKHSVNLKYKRCDSDVRMMSNCRVNREKYI